MNTREYLLKAQAAEAIADSSEGAERLRWEGIAAEYRKIARVAAVLRRFSSHQVASKPVLTQLPNGTSATTAFQPPLA